MHRDQDGHTSDFREREKSAAEKLQPSLLSPRQAACIVYVFLEVHYSRSYTRHSYSDAKYNDSKRKNTSQTRKSAEWDIQGNDKKSARNFLRTPEHICTSE